ncbi:MAG TPA: hypothetical protein PKK48_04045 [Phycisphaerae bacterium]|nr:hypothetical protein [Phycisphaerae bacterium]
MRSSKKVVVLLLICVLLFFGKNALSFCAHGEAGSATAYADVPHIVLCAFKISKSNGRCRENGVGQILQAVGLLICTDLSLPYILVLSQSNSASLKIASSLHGMGCRLQI